MDQRFLDNSKGDPVFEHGARVAFGTYSGEPQRKDRFTHEVFSLGGSFEGRNSSPLGKRADMEHSDLALGHLGQLHRHAQGGLPRLILVERK
jgi:hypothetical protein